MIQATLTPAQYEALSADEKEQYEKVRQYWYTQLSNWVDCGPDAWDKSGWLLRTIYRRKRMPEPLKEVETVEEAAEKIMSKVYINRIEKVAAVNGFIVGSRYNYDKSNPDNISRAKVVEMLNEHPINSYGAFYKLIEKIKQL